MAGTGSTVAKPTDRHAFRRVDVISWEYMDRLMLEESRLTSELYHFNSSVLGSTGRGGVERRRLGIAESLGGDSCGVDREIADQRRLDRGGAGFTQAQVRCGGSNVVGVSLDQDLEVGVLLQSAGNLFEHRPGLRLQLGLPGFEKDALRRPAALGR